MSNNIEQIIEEIEDYIEKCKYSPLSSTKILVNRDDLTGLLEELKLKTPGEIKKYQRMLANKESILEDAKQKAAVILAEAEEQASAMINAHEITQQAYIQGNDYVNEANAQAKKIIEQANQDGDEIRLNALRYTDELLEGIQNTIAYSMENITMRYEAYMKSLQKTLEMVTQNRNELYPDIQQQNQNQKLYEQQEVPVEEEPQPQVEPETEFDIDDESEDYEFEDEAFDDYTVDTGFMEEDE